LEGFKFLKPSEKLAELDKKARRRESKEASFETVEKLNLPSKQQKAKIKEAFELLKPQSGHVILGSVRTFALVLLGIKEPMEVRTSA
jgi:hypothetical protein